MFLRSHIRVKDGKQHRYFSVVESVRSSASRHPYQKTLLYLGEINAEQEAQWTRSMATFDPPSGQQLGRAAGSDRVTILWADGDVHNQWLQVTVNATERAQYFAYCRAPF